MVKHLRESDIMKKREKHFPPGEKEKESDGEDEKESIDE
jgi:hypothetical protein